jgi:hypothetical protein
MNKKGSGILDVLFIMVVLLALGISVIVLGTIFGEANDKLQDSGLGTESKEFAQNQESRFPNTMDKLFLVIFAGISISLFIGAFMLQTHPVFFIFTAIIGAFFVTIAAILGNVYEEFVSRATFSATESAYLIIPFVFQNYTFIMAGLVILLLVGLYAKGRAEPI